MAWQPILSVEELRAIDGVALFDCRFDLADPDAGERAFRAGHLPGARYLHLDRDLSGPLTGRNGRHPLPDRDRLGQRLAGEGLDASRPVVAYDDAGGAFAARLWWLLRWLGHQRVAVLDGGLPAWTAAGGRLQAGEPAPVPPGSFQPSAAPEMPVVEADGVLAAPRLVDARAPDRFAGDPHPLDPRPGHIPGAVNRFFRDNLGPNGRFKTADTLRTEYGALLAGALPAQAVFYCGSGVTAAHDLLAMHRAGLPGAALYPGSWSEWASDPARPAD
jgi:thiosulfate/3-mercaptopyruvate sulfurtransferase